jgi:signal transduction histidine kinase/DNA-binding response OmpR family regulator
MKALLAFLPWLLANVVFGQNPLDQKPTAADSVVLANYRNKVSQTINSQPDSALFYIRQLKQFSAKKNYLSSLTDADYLYAHYFRRIQNSDSALFYFKKQIAASKKINYFRGMAQGYNGLCRTYYLIGDMDQSIQAGNKAIALTKKFEDTGNFILADTQNALAIAYSRQNKMKEAIERLLLVDSLHKKQPLRPDIIAAAYQSLGNVYLELKEYDAAEEYYLKANRQFEKMAGGGTFYFNTTNVFLGQVYFHKGQVEKADSLLSKTLLFYDQIKEERTVAEISNYLGLIHLKKGNLDSAQRYFQNALNFQRKNDYSLEAGQSAMQLGKLNIEKGKPNLAIEYLEQALTFNRDIKNSTLNQNVYSLLAVAYAKQGNYKAAFTNSQLARKINDSIQQSQSAEKIKEIEGIYQTESRDKEIALLTAENELAEQQRKNQQYVLWGILAIIAIVAGFVFFQFRNRQKTTKKLRELDRAKSTFFANISHEFRTPLTLIKGPIEDYLQSGKLELSERKNLQSALRNTQRLKDLVDQLLALAKLESGSLKMNIQPANLPDFITAQAEAFTFSCGEKNIAFKIEVETDTKEDWFDQDILEKILYNLIGNAIKYTPENGRIILRGNRHGNRFVISVANSGNYIPLQLQQKIFTRFYQSDCKNPGTGIGLALTKDLVAIHRGSISVESEENGLTEFTVELPRNKVAFENELIFIPENENGISETNYPKPLIEKEIVAPEEAPVLLVIDDSQDIRDYLCSIFEDAYVVKTAANGKQGFALAVETIPDIVISDVMMPEEDGFTFTKHLKEHQLTSHIPVILLTAKTQITSKLEAMGIGADAYVTKPFNSQLLKATAQNLLDNRRKLQERFSQEAMVISKDIAVSSEDEKFFERMQKVLDAHLTQPDFSAEMFSAEMGVSRMQLYRKLKALTSQTPSEFIRSQRLKLAVSLLRSNKISISEIGYTVGFNDPSYFTKCFKQEFGCSPSHFISK